MFSEALSVPTRSRDATGTLFVGGGLLLFSVALPVGLALGVTVSLAVLVLAPLAVFLPLVVLGYDVRVIAAGIDGAGETPSFVDWTGLARDGLRSLVVRAAYLLPLVIVVAVVMLVLAGLRADAFGLAPRVNALLVAGVSILGGLLVVGYVVAYRYLQPAALAVLAATGSVRETLAFHRTLQVALSGEYAVGWTFAGVVLVVGLLVAVPLQLLLVGFPIAFYVRSVAYYAYGRGASGALAAAGVSTGGPDDDQPRDSLTETPEAPPEVQVGRGVEHASAGAGRTAEGSVPVDANRSGGPEGAGDPGEDLEFEFGTDQDGSVGGSRR